jgi:hypothetical protein
VLAVHAAPFRGKQLGLSPTTMSSAHVRRFGANGASSTPIRCNRCEGLPAAAKGRVQGLIPIMSHVASYLYETGTQLTA